MLRIHSPACGMLEVAATPPRVGRNLSGWTSATVLVPALAVFQPAHCRRGHFATASARIARQTQR